MSAIAAVQTARKTYLYSDGKAIYHDGSEVDDQRKIDKITDQIALFSVGRLKEGITEKIVRQLKNKGSKEPLEIAEIISMMLKAYMSDISYESTDHPSGEADTIFIVIGYDSDGRPTLYQINHKNDFEPQKRSFRGPKDITAMIYGEFSDKRSPYTPHLRKLLGQHELQIASYQAFVDMIDDHIDTGKVNKNIYSETVAPKLSSSKRCKTLQDIYNKAPMLFKFRQVSTASCRPNSEAIPLNEAHNSEQRFYNWYVIGIRTPQQYQVNLEAVRKAFLGHRYN